MSEMGRNICEEERCKKVDAQRISPSERGGREGRTGKRDTNRRTEKTSSMLQSSKRIQCLNRVEMTKLNNRDRNERYIKVIGISLDPSTLCRQNRLFIVKDCILPSKAWGLPRKFVYLFKSINCLIARILPTSVWKVSHKKYRISLQQCSSLFLMNDYKN